MEPNELDSLWSALKLGLEEIFTSQDPMSKSSFMKLYNTVYNYCQFTPPETPPGLLESMSVSAFVGSQLYIRLDLYLNGRVKTVGARGEERELNQILEYYATQWAQYQVGAKQANRVCTFFNSHWMAKEAEECRLEFRSVYELALSKWRTFVFEPLQASLTTVILNLIQKSRHQETSPQVDLAQVKIVLDSFLELGSTLKIGPSPLSLYETTFEVPFLAETEAYFHQTSQEILRSERDFVELLTLAEEKLDQERRRGRGYLHESTLVKLRAVGEKVLLKGHEKFRTRSFDGPS